MIFLGNLFQKKERSSKKKERKEKKKKKKKKLKNTKKKKKKKKEKKKERENQEPKKNQPPLLPFEVMKSSGKVGATRREILCLCFVVVVFQRKREENSDANAKKKRTKKRCPAFLEGSKGVFVFAEFLEPQILRSFFFFSFGFAQIVLSDSFVRFFLQHSFLFL